MEVFYEQNVNNPNIDKHKKRTTVLSVLRTVFLVIGLLFAFLLIGTVKVGSVLSTVIGIVIGALSGAPFVAAYFFIGKFIKNSNSEYDYVLNGNYLRIVRVTRRTKRKLLTTVPVSGIESIGKLSCEAYERYAAAKNVKKLFAVCNYEEEDKIAYIRYRTEGEDFLLHIEPNDEMVASLRKSLPRFSIMDKSMQAPIAKTV